MIRRYLLAIVFLIAALASVLVIFRVHLPSDTRLWREIHNSGHTPIFGLVSLLLVGVVSSLRIVSRRPLAKYLVALSVSVLVGIGVEVVQIWTAGDPDVGDALRDLAGAVSFLGIWAVFDRRLWSHQGNTARKYRVIIFAASMVILLASLAPLALCTGSYVYRNLAAPIIWRPDSYWGKRFWYVKDAQLEVVPTPDSLRPVAGNYVAKLTFMPGRYPAFVVEEIFPDWSKWDSLQFNIYSFNERPIPLTIRVDDFYHDGQYRDRFNRLIEARHGINRYAIAIKEIVRAPATRRMSIKNMWSIHLFASNLTEPVVVFLDGFRLK